MNLSADKFFRRASRKKSFKLLQNLPKSLILHAKIEIVAYDDKNADRILTFANIAT